jgi:ribonuclease P protein subunit RPR2
MSKRRISSQKKNAIGAERIDRLLTLSRVAASDGHEDRAKRYVELARRIGMKTRTKMPEGLGFCKGCMLPLVPGVNCRVRLSNHHVTTCCTSCGRIHRRPYLKEQRQ